MIRNMFFIFHGRFPSEKAASLFAAKSCEAFAEKGVQVTLLVPRRKGAIAQDPHAFYGIKKNFSVVYLPTVDLFAVPGMKWLAFQISFVVFSLCCLWYVLRKNVSGDWVYSNESLPLFLCSFARVKTLYEVHDFPERKASFYRMLLRRMTKVLVTNQWKFDRLATNFRVSKEKILCERNGVDVEKFASPLRKADARTKLGLPVVPKMAVYTGHLYDWKGVDTLAEAASYLVGKVEVYFVGGTEKDVAVFKKKYDTLANIHIMGFRPHTEILYWQKAADVLVLPNTAREALSQYYTSPMKLFEYMASGRPVVASRLLSVTEIVSEQAAVLVDPDSPEQLAEGIKKVVSDDRFADQIAAQAFEEVARHAWQKRAERITRFLES